MRAFAASCEGWNRFLSSLGFEQPLEFNEGDIGLAGGLGTLATGIRVYPAYSSPFV